MKDLIVHGSSDKKTAYGCGLRITPEEFYSSELVTPKIKNSAREEGATVFYNNILFNLDPTPKYVRKGDSFDVVTTNFEGKDFDDRLVQLKKRLKIEGLTS